MSDLPSNQSSNFVAGTGVTITFTETEGDYWDIEFTSTASGGGHTIQDDDTPVTARANLSFQDGFVVTDDAGGDQTEIDLDYGADITTQQYSDVAAAGTSIQVAREDHLHGMPAAGSGAPADADYLVGTANGSLSAEIVVGTSPGGELGGTWASPTVDATHSGSAHHTQSHDHSAAGDGTSLVPATLTVPNSAAPAQTAEGSAVWDTGNDKLTIGTGASRKTLLDEDHTAAADPHTGYRLESADHTHQSTGAQAGQLDHGLALTGLTDDDHTQYRLESADHTHQSTGLQGGTLDHGLALTGLTDDDHTQYRLESADHTHQSTGLQGGTLDHGLALTGLTDDDHTQYRLESALVSHVTFSKEGNLSTGTGTIRWYNDTGGNITLQSARGSVGTAPASQSILIDINNNGTSVWNTTQANRITIAASTNTDEGGAFDDSTIADGEYITVDIDQVGSGTVGADLSVTIWYTQ